MYHYGVRPQDYYAMMFLHQNNPVPYTYGPYSDMGSGHILPPIQMHNFSSRPYASMSGDPYYSQNGRLEYHHFYGVNPLYSMPSWPYPSYNSMPAYVPWMNYPNPQVHHKPIPNGWPEGFTMKGELHWGKLERVYGIRRDLPEFVREDLRRVYGTYPLTFVAITYQNGEYLVKGDPKVGEQEYTIEKKVVRRQPTPTDSEEETSNEMNNKRRRRRKR
ncbi:uncharacterized protein C10orf95 homolog [Hyperolius riggenbachi]|uniref:uncharacterized protein C10orf95 homolog n=1 Tax=Hyperolius riggenbachi TaxID=752182 RepID=UPI0035A281CE